MIKMYGERTYNMKYLKKVFTNNIIKYIEKKGNGIHHEFFWYFFPRTYDKEYIMMDTIETYREMMDVFTDVTRIFSSCKYITLMPEIDFEFKETSFSNWTIMIKEGYKEDLKKIKNKSNKIKNK